MVERRITALVLILLLSSADIAAADLRTVDDADEILPDESVSNVTVLNFWATWCVPCVAEMSDLRALSGQFDEKTVRFIGLSLDDAIPGDRGETRARVERFLDRQRIEYPNIYWIGSPYPILRRFDLDGEIPVTLVFDSQGREFFRHTGIIEYGALKREIDKQLQKGSHEEEK